jgi:hypothetical protein
MNLKELKKAKAHCLDFFEKESHNIISLKSNEDYNYEPVVFHNN